MSVYRLLDQVAQALRPSEEVFERLQEVLEEINKQLSLRDVRAKAVPGGSVAKNTFLRASHDVDVFVQFALSYADKDLSSLLSPCLKHFRAERVHGSRDYFLFEYRGYSFEVVPVLAISKPEEARNVTDASPLHVEYFNERGSGLEDEVRLAKQFAKAAGVYGAESFIRGFSGHVIDLLIIYYGSFYELARQASRWEEPVVIDVEEHHKNPLLAIDQAKHAPLILVDPIQPLRNAAAALSKEQFLLFKQRCALFVQEPTVHFFKVPVFSQEDLVNELAAREGFAFVLKLVPPGGDKRDVAGARVRKFYERLEDELVHAGFRVTSSDWYFLEDEPCIAYYVLAEEELAAVFEREGPPVSQEVHAQRFREEHGVVDEREGRLYAQVRRDVRTPSELLEVVGEELSTQTKVDYSLVDVPRGT